MGDNNDVMLTKLGPIIVKGYDDLSNQNNTVAVTLEAMVNLEIKQYLKGASPPTQMEILLETIRLGSGLSEKSPKIISQNIKKLIELGHVVYRQGSEPDEDKKNRRGRGGKTSPWQTIYVADLVSSLLQGHVS